ncbi:MAG: SH3 domain-containing protein [Clostridia bacterium]|nr:SH3 domain-containing protein [Clostridia bacterium]
MKRIIVLCIALLLVSCNNNDHNAMNKMEPTDNETIIKPSNTVEENNPLEENLASKNEASNVHEDHLTPIEVIVGVEILNVRSEANLEGEVIGQLKKDERCKVSEIKVIDDAYWYKNVYEDQEAWIAGWFTYEMSQPQIKVLSEMDNASELMGFLYYKDVFQITEEHKVCAVEVSQNNLNIWLEIEFNGQKGYITYVNYMRNNLSFADSFEVVIGSEKLRIDGANKDISYKMDNVKNQLLLKVEDQLMYFNGLDEISALQNTSLSGPEISLEDYLPIYNNENKISFTLEPNQIYVVDDVLISETNRIYEGKHTLEQYEIVNGELSLSSIKELTVLPYQQIIDVYDELSRGFLNASDTLSITQLNQYKCEATLILIHETGYSKFYEFTRNGKKLYVKKGFEKTPKETDVILLDGTTYTIEGDIIIKDYMHYLGEYFEYTKDNMGYFFNGKTGKSTEADQVFYDPDLRYVVLVKENRYQIYSLNSNFDLLYDKKAEGNIADVFWESDQMIIELGEKYYDYLESFNGRLFFTLDSGGVKLDPNASEYVAVYDHIGDDAIPFDTLSSYDQKNNAYSLALSLSDAHMTAWAKVEQGYLKKEYLGYQKRNDYAYSPYSSRRFDLLLDGQGNVIDNEFVNFRIQRSTLEDQDIYILEKDYGYYAYHGKNHDLVYLGAYYGVMHEGKYIIASEKSNNQLVVKLYETDTLNVLDELRFEGITYDLFYSGDEKVFIHCDPSEEITLDNYLVESIVLEVKDNQLISVYPDLTDTGISVYDGLGEENKIVMYLPVDTEASLEFLNTYELIDDQMVMWYKLTTKDLVGYAYKPFRAADSIGYQYDTYDLIYEDGSKETIEISGDCVYNYVTDELSPYGYFTSYYAWEGPPGGSFYNMTTKEVFRTDGHPVVSPNGKYFFSYNNGYYEISSSVSVYKMTSENIELVFEKGFGAWEIIGGRWTSNTSFEFDAIGVETYIKKKIVFNLINDVWSYTME